MAILIRSLFYSTILPLTISLSILPILILSQDDKSYNYCSPFRCGNTNFSFPFSSNLKPFCGLPGFQITCDDPSSGPKLLLSGRLFQVKNLFISETDRLLTLVDTQLIRELTTGSCESFHNLSIANNSTGSLTLPPGTVNFTFYKCSNEPFLSKEFTNNVVNNVSCDDGDQLYLWRNGSQFDPPSFNPVLAPTECRAVLVPVSSVSYLFFNASDSDGDNNTELIVKALRDGFPLEWPAQEECGRCQTNGGRCGYDWSLEKDLCFCSGGCSKPSKWKKKLLIAGSAIGSCFVVLIGVFVFRKKISVQFFNKSSYSERNPKSGDGLNVKQFIKTYRSTLLTNYSYNDVKKITSSFKQKLGAGGYGNVYKGKFPDGRLVAVKMIEKTNDIGHNFVNEVATIGRIHHFNIINLLGFCCDGSTRALLYEYMPNGSLGDLLSRSEEAPHSLGLVKLLEIALGVAHAIEYLHNGCELRILHLDIKPQNVLLDQDLNPKISDFGLAKVHSRNRSTVTMTDARGTIGYIAPEVFLRNLGSISHKSDVYSYGMLLLEMIGGRKHLEQTKSITSSSSTESYFPDRIYDNLIQDYHSLKHDEISLPEDEIFLARKMAMVGLWCIQISPRDRPSMTKVLEMLSGNLEAIAMPPKPFFLSPSPTEIQNNEVITSIDSDTSELPLTSDTREIYYSAETWKIQN